MSALLPRVNAIPVPNPAPESMTYWEGTRTGELRYQRCSTCDTANFGPGLRCSNCQAGALEWQVSAGIGSVFSWTVVWRPQTPAFEVPYAPAIVRMDEGYDMMSALVGIEPDAIAVDLRVGVEFHQVSDTITLPFFSPRTEAPHVRA